MSKYVNQGDIPTVQIYDSEVKKYKIQTSLDSILGTRKNQQDSAFVQSESGLTVGIVCDGMGGLNAGEVASQMAVTQFIEAFYREEVKDIPLFMEQEIVKIDQNVFDAEDENHEKLGAGTTLVAVIIRKDQMYCASVGDSRIYLIRNSKIHALNRLHNYREQLDRMLRQDMITEAEYRKEEPKAEALTSFVGMGNLLILDVTKQPMQLKDGDVILLCSDGLYKTLSEEQMRAVVENHNIPWNLKARALTRKAEEETISKQDNTTVVLIKYNE